MRPCEIRFRDTLITLVHTLIEIFRWKVRLGINIILAILFYHRIVEIDPTTRKRGLSCIHNMVRTLKVKHSGIPKA